MGLKNRLANWLLKGSGNFGTDEMIRALYEFYGNGAKFVTDNVTYKPIKDGYEKSPDVFAIADKIATYFGGIDYIPYRIGTEEESETDPLASMFENNPIDLTLFEFKKYISLFMLIYGNSIVHAPKFGYGNNAGQLIKMSNLPVQNIEIESGDLNNIIKSYGFTVGDTKIKLLPDEVWHMRSFLNLDFDNGKNLMGISPIKVAAKLIEAQNGGYDLAASTYKNPLPPVIISKKDKSTPLNEDQRADIEKTWRRKTRGDRSAMPFFTTGDLQAIRMGYDNFKDLNTIENSQNGIRVLCNIWGVPSTLFNDSAHSRESNKKEAKKDMYEGRIIPDTNLTIEGLNRLFKPYGIYYKPDWSKVPALQQDNLEKARIFEIGLRNRAVLENEFRTEVLGLEELDEEMVNELRMNAEFNNNMDNLLDNENL
jgi:HK97 family phage portal protein